MNNKLELTWFGKEREVEVEPRILIQSNELSFSKESYTLFDNEDITDNILIHGDNLLALKALEQNFTGKVKCI